MGLPQIAVLWHAAAIGPVFAIMIQLTQGLSEGLRAYNAFFILALFL